MSPIDFSLFDEIVFYPTCTEKPILKFLYNKFFSIYNYLFRFFCLFGFQWTVSRTLYAGGDDGIRTHDPLLAGQVLSQLSYTPILKWFVVFSVFCRQTQRVYLVGPSGLEPPTSCLSGTRSNLLSYEPMWLVSDFSSLGVFGIRKEAFTSSLSEVSALSYLPVQSPVKYFRHCRA